MELHEDREWLMAFRRGERPALERVFRTYIGYVVVILRRGARTADGRRVEPVTNPDEQQDLLHDVFVRVFSPSVREGYDGTRPFAPYLAQVTRNALADHARRKARESRRWVVMDEPADADLASWRAGEPLPDELIITREQAEQVRAFRDTLSEEERTFVTVRFEQGASQRVAATTLGTTRHRIRELDEEVTRRLRAFLATWKRPASRDP